MGSVYVGPGSSSSPANEAARWTIGYLASFVHGYYYGSVLAGVVDVTARVGGRVVAIQTRDAGMRVADSGTAPFTPRVGWKHIDAFVVVQDAVPDEYLRELRRADKPIVLVSHEVPGLPCPTVIPDDEGGTGAAVEHLISHGHRRIAFVSGGPVGIDGPIRLRAYEKTTRDHGLEPYSMVLPGMTEEAAGMVAARRLLAEPVPPTAIVAVTDVVAIGVLRTLREAGVAVPADIAVIGFDDLDDAATHEPPLSTVSQSFSLIGTMAAELAVGALRGAPIVPGHYRAATSLVRRETCGCQRGPVHGAQPDRQPGLSAQSGLSVQPAPSVQPSAVAGAAPERDAAGRFLLDLVEAAREDGVITPGRGRELTAVGHRLVDLFERVAADPDADVAARVPELAAATYRLAPRGRAVLRIAPLLRRFARELAAERTPPDGGVATKLEDMAYDLGLAIVERQFRAQSSEYLRFHTLRKHYEIGTDLLRRQNRDSRSLTWLAETEVHAGCFAIWAHGRNDDGAATALRVVGTYDRADRYRATGDRCDVREFPPLPFLDLIGDRPDELMYLLPVRFDGSDWGFLALIGSLEMRAQTALEMFNQWAVLLTVSLDQEQAVRSLVHHAMYDATTGLPNRTLFLDRLNRAIALAKRRSDYWFAVLFLDLDRFKVINDSLGHQAGDDVLREVARRLAGEMRENDTAARFGGDEFAILLNDVRDVADLPATVDRILASLSAPLALGARTVFVSASVGIAVSLTGYETAEQFLRDADTAMYRAKGIGNGASALFDETMHTAAMHRLQLEADLRKAIADGQFELLYQPILELGRRRVAGLEALIRWNHPSRGVVAPADFLPVAESTGLIVPIGRWTVGEACRQLAEWRAAMPERDDLTVSINLSNRQFWDPELLSYVRRALAEHGVPASALVFEMTEGVIMHSPESASRLMAELHAEGIRLHVDDFGTGYSSLEALHNFPIHALKIDRSFISRIGADARSRELVRIMVAMGRTLDVDVIAEGIETESQARALTEMDCPRVQGFLFAHPLPAPAVPPLLAGRFPPIKD